MNIPSQTGCASASTAAHTNKSSKNSQPSGFDVKTVKNASFQLAKLLRHDAKKKKLEISSKGWVSVEAIESARIPVKNRCDLTQKLIKAILETHEGKQRFELDCDNNRVRCYQGHSIDGVNAGALMTPPDYLYHVTTIDKTDSIVRNGLLRQQRAMVHLFGKIDEALEKSSEINFQLLKINSKQMDSSGVEFYKSGNPINTVWLVDHVPAQYIGIVNLNEIYPDEGDFQEVA